MEGVRAFVHDVVGGLLDFALSISTSLAARGSVKAKLRGTDVGSTGSEDVPDSEVWGLAGFLYRPKAPSGSDGCEMIVVRWNDEFLPIASRDLRFQPTNIAEGEVLVHALGKDGATQATIRLKPDGSVVVDGAKVELGAGAVESVIKGDAFKTYFNSHVHLGGTLVGGLTGIPNVLMDVGGIHLSSVVKTK